MDQAERMVDRRAVRGADAGTCPRCDLAPRFVGGLRAASLAVAWVWAGAVVAFYFGYHIAEPSSPWLVANGHTYFTHPPARTLAQSDHVSAASLVSIALRWPVVIGTLHLAVRLVRRATAPGLAAISAGRNA